MALRVLLDRHRAAQRMTRQQQLRQGRGGSSEGGGRGTMRRRIQRSQVCIENEDACCDEEQQIAGQLAGARTGSADGRGQCRREAHRGGGKGGRGQWGERQSNVIDRSSSVLLSPSSRSFVRCLAMALWRQAAAAARRHAAPFLSFRHFLADAQRTTMQGNRRDCTRTVAA